LLYTSVIGGYGNEEDAFEEDVSDASGNPLDDEDEVGSNEDGDDDEIISVLDANGITVRFGTWFFEPTINPVEERRLGGVVIILAVGATGCETGARGEGGGREAEGGGVVVVRKEGKRL
jgi:hypothetical protein